MSFKLAEKAPIIAPACQNKPQTQSWSNTEAPNGGDVKHWHSLQLETHILSCGLSLVGTQQEGVSRKGIAEPH